MQAQYIELLKTQEVHKKYIIFISWLEKLKKTYNKLNFLQNLNTFIY